MKLYKGFLHFFITLVSTFAFLMGWATLAHSLKPTQPIDPKALVELEPLAPVGSVRTTTQTGGLFSAQPRARTRSTFVTRGS